MKKAIIFIIGLIILIGVGTCIYFVGGTSATIPSIKEYEVQTNVDQLIASVKLFVSTKPNLSLSVGQTLGDKSNGYAHDATITIKGPSQNLLYTLKFEGVNGANLKTKLLLIGAHNLADGTGGYGTKADGMIELVNNFNSYIIVPLQKEQNVRIKPL